MGRSRPAVSRYVVVLSVALIVIAAGIAAYFLFFVESGPKEPIRLAFINGFTGAFSSCASESWLAAELAVEEINGAGGVNGRPIELIKLDDQSNPSQAVALARLADQQYNVLAITGICQSDNALALRGYAEENKVPVVISVAAAADATLPDTKWVVRVDPDTIQLGAATAKFIIERWPNARIALIYSDLAFSREVAAGLKWYVETSKGATIVYDQRFPVTQADFTAAVAAIRVQNPDIIWMGLFGPGPGNFFKKAIEAGFKPDQFVSALELSLFIVPLGPDGAGSYAAAYFSESLQAGKPFVEKMRPRLANCQPCGKSVSHSSYSTYLSIYLIAEAAKRAGTPLTRESFMNALRGVEFKDLLGRTIRLDENGAVLTGFYFVRITKVEPPSWQSSYLTYIEFPKGAVPVYDIAKRA